MANERPSMPLAPANVVEDISNSTEKDSAEALSEHPVTQSPDVRQNSAILQNKDDNEGQAGCARQASHVFGCSKCRWTENGCRQCNPAKKAGKVAKEQMLDPALQQGCPTQPANSAEEKNNEVEQEQQEEQDTAQQQAEAEMDGSAAVRSTSVANSPQGVHTEVNLKGSDNGDDGDEAPPCSQPVSEQGNVEMDEPMWLTPPFEQQPNSDEHASMR